MLTPLQNLPGIDAAIETVENEFLFGPQGTWVPKGIQIDSAAVDAGSTPTTTLRKGLVLGIITSTGLYSTYSRSNTDGTQEPVLILYVSTNMLDLRSGSARNKSTQGVYAGHIKTANVYGLDEYARRKLAHRYIWDDFRQPRGGFDNANVSANYTLVTTDNGKHFIYNGAAGGNLTLPAPAHGLAYRFTNNVDQTLQIMAGAGNIAGPGNLSAANVSLITSTAKKGYSFEMVPNANATQWILLNLSGNNTAFTFS